MKKLILLLSCISFLSFANAQNWQTVGNVGFSDSAVAFTTIAIDSSGVPYVAYEDFSFPVGTAGKATVKKYNGSSWVTVGNAGFSAGGAGFTCIAIDGKGTPYVVCSDLVGNQFGPATVMKYNDTSWVTVGSAQFSAGGASYTSIAIDSSGTPYVAYEDMDNDSKITVMKYNGSSWVTVGSAGFSAGKVGWTSIAIDRSGTPYVVYWDGNSISGGATAMKYDGSNWVTLGSAGFSAGGAYYTSIAINSSGTPYVVYSDDAYSYKATVMRYNGSSWVAVGSAGFSARPAYYTSIAIDGSGTPYVVYSDNGDTGPATVMKYNGSNWVTVGSAEFSAAGAVYPSIAIDRSGSAYVAYSDWGNNYRATVKKYSTITGAEEIASENSFALYPNPSTNQLTIHTSTLNNNAATVSIMNVLGEIMQEEKVKCHNEVSINVKALPSGIYIIQLVSGNERRAGKFIKE